VIQHELAAFQRQLAGEATTGPWIRRNPVAALAGRRTGSAGPETAQRLRAVVLGPRGGGTTRRRASDAFRLAFAVVVVAVSVPVMRANSAAELSIVHALNPPPEAIRWLVTSVFWLGSAGVIACLAVLALLVPRLAAVRRIAVATWAVCGLLGTVLGPAAGRPATDALAGVDTSYPVTQLAVTIAVAATALPFLSRPLHRLVSSLITVGDARLDAAPRIRMTAGRHDRTGATMRGWRLAAGCVARLAVRLVRSRWAARSCRRMTEAGCRTG
jgi:hypothetical protein